MIVFYPFSSYGIFCDYNYLAWIWLRIIKIKKGTQKALFTIYTFREEESLIDRFEVEPIDWDPTRISIHIFEVEIINTLTIHDMERPLPQTFKLGMLTKLGQSFVIFQHEVPWAENLIGTFFAIKPPLDGLLAVSDMRKLSLWLL